MSATRASFDWVWLWGELEAAVADVLPSPVGCLECSWQWLLCVAWIYWPALQQKGPSLRWRVRRYCHCSSVGDKTKLSFLSMEIKIKCWVDHFEFKRQPLTGLSGTCTGFPPAIVTIGRWHSEFGSITITCKDTNVLHVCKSHHFQN